MEIVVSDWSSVIDVCDVTEALIEDQVRQLQAEEAARQMGVFNQLQQPSVLQLSH